MELLLLVLDYLCVVRCAWTWVFCVSESSVVQLIKCLQVMTHDEGAYVGAVFQVVLCAANVPQSLG